MDRQLVNRSTALKGRLTLCRGKNLPEREQAFIAEQLNLDTSLSLGKGARSYYIYIYCRALVCLVSKRSGIDGLGGVFCQRPRRQGVTGTSLFIRLFLLEGVSSTLSDSMTKSDYVVFRNMLNRHFYDLIRDIFLAVFIPASKVLSLNSYTS